MIFSKELEKLAEELARQVYPMSFHENDRSVGKFLFKEGASALENLIMKSEPGFDVLPSSEAYDEVIKQYPNISCDQFKREFAHSYWQQGARWQNSQSQLIIGALREELRQKNENGCCIVEHGYRMEAEHRIEDQKAYIEQLEKASDTQSNQYHQMRDKLQAENEQLKAEIKRLNDKYDFQLLVKSNEQLKLSLNKSEEMYHEMELLYLNQKRIVDELHYVRGNL